MIGKHYKKYDYHCMHYVAERYERTLGIEIPIIDEFERSFLRWMREHFSPIDSPENECLVKMSTRDGKYHVGVYADYGVYHNYQIGNAYGSVIHSEMSMI